MVRVSCYGVEDAVEGFAAGSGTAGRENHNNVYPPNVPVHNNVRAVSLRYAAHDLPTDDGTEISATLPYFPRNTCSSTLFG